jgi:large subunit ribosomal protein L30
MAAVLSIKQLRSANGSDRAQRETLRTLGLRGIGSTSERADGPAIRGMLRKVAHLVAVEDQGGGSARSDG